MIRQLLNTTLRFLLFWGLFGWWVGGAAVALDPRKAVTEYGIAIWQEELPQNTVHAVTQTRDGYIWIATYEGLARFDGIRFTIFNKKAMPFLASNGVFSLCETRDGSLWIGTNNEGLIRYHNRQFKHFTQEDGLPGNFVYTLFESSQGDLWIGTNGGLARYRAGSIRAYTVHEGVPHNEVRAFAEDHDGSLWVGTTAGLYHLKTDSQVAVQDKIDASVRALCFEKETLWIGTEGNGLIRLKQGSFTWFAKPEGFGSDTVRSLALDPRGGLWIGTETEGLFRLSQGIFSQLTTTQGLPGNIIRSLAIDQEGSLWGGTNGGGLFCLKDQKVMTFTTLHGLTENNVRVVMEDSNGWLWIGTEGGGVCCFRDGERKVLTTANGLGSNHIRALLEDHQGQIWIGTNGGGVSRIQNDHITTYTMKEGLLHNVVYALCEDHQGRLWIGTRNGINFFEPPGHFTAFQGNPDLPHRDTALLYEDMQGNMWIGSTNGLACFHDGILVNYAKRTPALSGTILDLHETPDQSLWVCLNRGLIQIQADRVNQFRDQDQLLESSLFKILPDDRGRFWISSTAGIIQVERKDLTDFTEGRISTVPTVLLAQSDGMKRSQCNGASQPAGWRTRTGRLIFATIQGLAMVDPGCIPTNPNPPPVAIEQVVVDDTGLDPTQPLMVAPGADKFEFRYTALSFLAPEKVCFRIKLEGYDTDWRQVGTMRAAYYNSLPPRTYRFYVKACNNDGIWNESGAVLTFTLLPRWYQTWWAWFLFIGITGSFVFGGVQYRLLVLRQRNEELQIKIHERTEELAATVDQLKQSDTRTQEKAMELARTVEKLQQSERKAQESERQALASKNEAERANQAKSIFFSNLSHELRTPLNAVIGFAQLLHRDRGLKPDQRETLDIIVRSGEHLLSLINDVLSISKIEAGKTSLVAHPFDLHRLLQDLQNMVRVRAQAKGLLLLFSVDREVPTVVSGDEGKLRQILLNLLGNAVKFTDTGSVTLRVWWNDGKARFSVEDTGQGMETDELERSFQPFEQTASGVQSKEGTGLGLFISRSFVKLMGGELSVRSEIGAGTTFEFEVPLPYVDGPLAAPEPVRKIIGLQPGQPTRRLLVADDKQENRILLRKLLESVGFEVREAANGTEAVAEWKQWSPDLIFMDMRMPIMDGYDATKVIRKAETGRTGEISSPEQQCKIIACTASAFEHEREAILRAGCNDLVIKPFGETTIFEQVREHLRIEFCYETSALAAADKLSHETFPEQLRQLPSELVSELYQSLVMGNVKIAYQVTERIAALHPNVAKELQTRMKNCQFDDLLEVLERIPAEL